ncbi:hypothetical protein HPB51_026516 [Rhipicephalus microplus]|uniref:Uncharacterized protein n=1 Tax=Rhipicephalus microplus TaxID=6941 RepID=A0A9J6D2D0_RHIMP|nr:hypothetical protein HPB51_026516 [Rhipicephalus microplus]
MPAFEVEQRLRQFSAGRLIQRTREPSGHAVLFLESSWVTGPGTRWCAAGTAAESAVARISSRRIIDCPAAVPRNINCQAAVRKGLSRFRRARKNLSGDSARGGTVNIRYRTAAAKLQKEFKNYVLCIKSLQLASKALMDTLSEIYEQEWVGHEQIPVKAQTLELLWDDYHRKMNDQVMIPLNS